MVMLHLMCYVLLNEILGLQMLGFGTLVPQGSCDVLYTTTRQFTKI